MVKRNELPLNFRSPRKKRPAPANQNTFPHKRNARYFSKRMAWKSFHQYRSKWSDSVREREKGNGTDDDDNGCSYEWKSHRLSVLLNYWFGRHGSQKRKDELFFCLFFNVWPLPMSLMTIHLMKRSIVFLSQSKFQRIELTFFSLFLLQRHA